MNFYVILIGFSFLIFLSHNNSYANEIDEILILENITMDMIKESNFDSALFYIDEILKIDPNNQNALNNKGGILLNIGNYSEAISNFDRVLLINENNTEAINNKAIALTFQIQYTEAIKLFYKSLLLNPSNEITFKNIQNLIDKLYFIDQTPKSFGVIKVKDGNGNIVVYSKIYQVTLQPPLGFMFIKNVGESYEIIIDGVKHEVVKFSGTIPITKNQFVGTTELYSKINDFEILVGEITFNGFIATYEDLIEYEVFILDPEY